MNIIEWWRKDGKKPLGIIGLDNKGMLFISESIVKIIGFGVFVNVQCDLIETW